MAEEARRAGDGGDAGVELSLRLGTGDDGSSSAAEEAAAARSMTIFYDGRACTARVTELQARTIISMAKQEKLEKKQQQQRLQVRDDRHYHQASNSCSSSSGATAQYCAAGSSQPPPAAPSPGHQGVEAAAAMAAAPAINQTATGLSMKRSLQQFLEKRKTRMAQPRRRQ